MALLILALLQRIFLMSSLMLLLVWLIFFMVLIKLLPILGTIAVRYTQDAFSRSGWLWPVDAKGEPLKATSYMAVGFYVAKYVNKKSDMDLAAKGLGAKEWNNSLKTKLSLLPKKLFRIRMSR